MVKRILKSILIFLSILVLLIGCTDKASSESAVKKSTSDTTSATQVQQTQQTQTQQTEETKEADKPVEPVIDAIVKGEKQTLGTWWWNAPTIKNKFDREKRLDFLKKNNITEIYLYYSHSIGDDYYRKFIAECTELGIRVAALNGDAKWVLDEGKDDYEDFLKSVENYQKNSAPNEKFYGLHLDVEPHQLPQWGAKPKELLPGFTYVVDRAVEFCKQNDMLSEFDILMWLDDKERMVKDGNGEVTIGEYIIKRIDTVSIMAYRDTGARQYADSLPEINLARKYNKKVILGSETGKSDEAEFVTYYEEGKTVLNEELKKLKGYMLESANYDNFGFAIHHVQAWMTLKD